MTEHFYALRAVSRDTIGVPRCSDDQLRRAHDAGLIRFNAWPSGYWSLTPEGARELAEAEGRQG